MSETPVFNPETASLPELKAHIENLAAEEAKSITMTADEIAAAAAAEAAVAAAATVDPAAALAAEEAAKVEAAKVAEAAEAAEAAKVAAAAEEEVDTVYQRRIDLGDGSGIQVFQGSTLEELTDKLVEAQMNATKKIREQQKRLEELAPKPVVKRERTADEEFVLAQEFASTPSKAFEKMFLETVGMPMSDFKTKLEKVEAFDRAQSANQAAEQFVALHPEYYAIPRNGTRIQNYMKTYNMPGTVDNITKAYEDLKASNLLEAKPVVPDPVEVAKAAELATAAKVAEAAAAATATANEAAAAEATRVAAATAAATAAAAAAVITKQRSGSGLSTRGTVVPPPVVSAEPTNAELYAMPLEQLKALGNKASPPDPHDF